MKLNKSLSQKFKGKTNKAGVEAADELLRSSLEQNLRDNYNVELNEIAGAVDSFLIDNPSFVDGLNRKLDRLGIEGARLNYDNVEEIEDNGLRGLTVGNSGCDIVGCSDIMMMVYDCQSGIEEYTTNSISIGTCTEQFASFTGKPRARFMGENSIPFDLSPSFQRSGTPVATDFLVCTTLAPYQIGGMVEISRRRLKCNDCLNMLEFVMIQAPLALKRKIRDDIYQLMNAQATNLPATTSGIRQTLISNQTSVLTTGKVGMSEIIHVMDPVTFQKFFYDSDAMERPYVLGAGICPPQTCKVYCIDGFNILVDDSMPLGTVDVNGTYSSKIYSGKIAAIATKQTRPEISENLLNNSPSQGVRVEFIMDLAVAMPINQQDTIVQRSIAFPV